MKKIIFFAIHLVLFLIIPALSFSEQIDSPKKQMEKGIAPEQVICKEELELVIRSNGSPACVKHDTAIKLEERGAKIIPQSKTVEPVEPKTVSAEPKAESLPTETTSQDCSGNAQCFSGTVTSVTDGDTIDVDGRAIRFALASAPELNESDGEAARELINSICPRGSTALVDEDDGQTQGSYGRVLAVVYCNGMNLNAELLNSGLGYLASGFCDQSEFASTSWAKKHGCIDNSGASTPKISSTIPAQPKKPLCDPSYPEFCIPPPPPDLDCNDIPYTDFLVLSPDSHRFDADKDGIGCESEKPAPQAEPEPAPKAEKSDCDPSYPDFCIASPPPDLDCKDIPYTNFRVLQPDPHHFDGDKDGIGCEKSSSSSTKQSTTTDCDPSYPDFCIPPPPPDLDCKDIPQKRFTVLQPDPHHFDGDKDGIGCES